MGIFLPSYSRSSTYYRRSNKPRTPVTTFSYSANDAWSAAAAATRINNGYLKEAKFEYDEDKGGTFLVAEANKVMVRKLLEANQGWTEEDVARGAEARAYWAQGGLIKLMEGSANSFETTAISIAQKEVIDSAYDLAVLSSLIASAERGSKRDELAQVKRVAGSRHVGAVGEKITLTNMEVLSSRYVESIGKYRNEAKLEGNLYAWWGNEIKTATVSVKGKIKAHITDRDTGAKVTQLNYTKVEG